MEEKGIRQEERATATTDMGKEGITAQENRETGVSPAGKEKERRKREPEKPLTPKQLQQRRKLLAYPLMGLLFLGSMWLIFAPSDQRDRVQQGVGAFNAEIPLPQDEGILDDKRTAYEQAEMEQNRNRSSQRWNRLSEKPEHFWHRNRSGTIRATVTIALQSPLTVTSTANSVRFMSNLRRTEKRRS